MLVFYCTQILMPKLLFFFCGCHKNYSRTINIQIIYFIMPSVNIFNSIQVYCEAFKLLKKNIYSINYDYRSFYYLPVSY